MTGWNDFFQTQAGAAANLAGLVLVGVSLNLARVLASAHLPNRALETLAMLLVALTSASLALWPRQDVRALGAEVLPVAALAWIGVILLHRHNWRTMEPAIRRRAVWGLVLGQITAASFTCAGALLISGSTAGPPLLAAACLLTFALTFLNAWLLLVEINR